jgi:hypothetical protein
VFAAADDEDAGGEVGGGAIDDGIAGGGVGIEVPCDDGGVPDVERTVDNGGVTPAGGGANRAVSVLLARVSDGVGFAVSSRAAAGRAASARDVVSRAFRSR